MKILALDPGQTTGYCVLHEPCDVFETGEFILNRGGMLKLTRLIDEAELVVYEDFRLYANKSKAMIGNDFPSSQVIGMIKYIEACVVCGGRPTFTQMASQRLIVPELLIQKVYPDYERVSDHINDAVEHALAFSLFSRGNESHPTVQKIFKEVLEKKCTQEE